MSDLIGYARTSTVEQEAGLEAQIKLLRATGCKKVFSEYASSIGDRGVLSETLNYLREGDTLVVTKLDRLARSTRHLLEIVQLLEDGEIALRILDFGGDSVDTSGPSGKLLLTVFGAFAQFEREMMLERQREGIAKAKAAGKYKGRAPTARDKSFEVLALKKDGVGPSDIARRTGIGRSSVYRILAASNE